MTPIGNSQRALRAFSTLQYLDCNLQLIYYKITHNICWIVSSFFLFFSLFFFYLQWGHEGGSAGGFTDGGIPNNMQHSECFTRLSALSKAMVFLKIWVTHLLDLVTVGHMTRSCILTSLLKCCKRIVRSPQGVSSLCSCVSSNCDKTITWVWCHSRCSGGVFWCRTLFIDLLQVRMQTCLQFTWETFSWAFCLVTDFFPL